MAWYKREVGDVFKTLQTSEGGLDSSQAQSRLNEYGPNIIEEAKTAGKLEIFLNQFKNPLIYILIIAAAVTFFLKDYVDMGVILAAVLLNALVGFVQEYKAGESAKALRKMLAPKAIVIRDSRQIEIESEKLVPGDIVVLSQGSRIPADMRLFDVVELAVDESILTGESTQVQKIVQPLDEDLLIPGDQKNMAFLGTFVVGGRGVGVVVETGDKTVMGSIAQDVKQAPVTETPLQRQFHSFAKKIGAIVLASSVLFFLFGLAIGESIRDMFKLVIAITVASIPEGLPVVVTIALAVGASRMTRRNAIIKKLPAVETLGCTTVICSDKTGTLTKNEMTVKKLWVWDKIVGVTGEGYNLDGHLTDESGKKIKPCEDTINLLRVGALCNNSQLSDDGIIGAPTEASILVASKKAGVEVDEILGNRVHEMPFSSERKRLTVAYKTQGGNISYTIGAPDIVLGLCSRMHSGGGDKDLTAEARERVSEAINILSSKAYRVVAASYKRVEGGDFESAEKDLVFSGLFAIMDPPRPEAIEAVKKCKSAGIRTIMITGDYSQTAVAIAQKLGIAGDEPKFLNGRQLSEMDDEELFLAVRDVSVYARVTPHHKLRIVEQLIRHGEIVAVTGDGVNDAPALKAAHIGVAMGKTGSDVAKESAEMILSDDNFASIVAAVEEGRIVYSNIRKVTLFLLPTGVAAIASIMAALFMGLPIPFLAAQLLWINIVTNGLQDVALAFEPGEKNMLSRKPRKADEGILSKLMIKQTLVVSALMALGVSLNYMHALHQGASIEAARTVAVTTMVFFQFFHVWERRSENQSLIKTPLFSNKFLFISIIAALMAQAAFIYSSPLQWIFQTVPLTLNQWVRVLVASSTIIAVIEAEKYLRRKNQAQIDAPKHPHKA
jgi:calcium-translocating P-type ATPase